MRLKEVTVSNTKKKNTISELFFCELGIPFRPKISHKHEVASYYRKIANHILFSDL